MGPLISGKSRLVNYYNLARYNRLVCGWMMHITLLSRSLRLLFFGCLGWSCWSCCYRSRNLREPNHRNRSTTGSPIGNGLWPSMRWASFPHEWVILENQLGGFRSFNNFTEQITYIIIGGTYIFVMTGTQWQEFLIKLFRYVFLAKLAPLPRSKR